MEIPLRELTETVWAGNGQLRRCEALGAGGVKSDGGGIACGVYTGEVEESGELGPGVLECLRGFWLTMTERLDHLMITRLFLTNDHRVWSTSLWHLLATFTWGVWGSVFIAKATIAESNLDGGSFYNFKQAPHWSQGNSIPRLCL